MAARGVAQEIVAQVRVVGAAPQVVVRVADGEAGFQRVSSVVVGSVTVATRRSHLFS